MKKNLTLFLLLTLFTLCFTSCGSEPITHSAVVEGAIFGGKSDDKITVNASFDPAWITSGNNKKYNADLAQFCALLTTDSYYREKDVAKGTQNRILLDGKDGTDYTPNALLESFGFTDAEHYESFKVLEDPTDSNDSVTLNIGHQTINKTDLYVVVIRGCFSWQEWCSAFDPGCGNEAYEKLTGAHPDWTHKEIQKGIDIAANRALAFINDYMSKHNAPELKDKLLITGHSRGGTIANILGAHFEKEGKIKTYTYTFNAMVAAEAENNYQTVFNVFDTNDFFTDPFPFAENHFIRFGKDISLSISDDAGARQEIKHIKGRDDYAAMSAEKTQEYKRLFAERFPNRESLCNKTEVITRTYDDQESAEKDLAEMNALVSAETGMGLEDLVTVSEILEADGKFTFTVSYVGLALLRSYAKILAYGSAANDAVAKIFAEDTVGCQIAALITENIDAINGAHLMVNSYVLAGYAK